MTNTAPSSTRAPKKTKIVVWILLAVAIVAAIIGDFVAQYRAPGAAGAARLPPGAQPAVAVRPQLCGLDR